MVRNLWKNVTLVCSEHPGEKFVLELDAKYNYVCPKHCGNSISLREVEKMLDFLADKIRENELNDNVEILTGFTWKDKRKAIYYEVLSHDHKNGILEIKMQNRTNIRTQGGTPII